MNDSKVYEFSKDLPFTGQREKLAGELANLLMSNCDSVSIKRSLKLEKMSLIYAAIKKDEKFLLERPPVKAEEDHKFMMSQLSLNCVCGEGTVGLIQISGSDSRFTTKRLTNRT